MYLFIKKIHINKSTKPYILNIFKTISILLTTSLLGCFQDYPTHRPPIEGSIDISKNDKGDLCFGPIFSSATVMKDPINFNYIKMEELAILDPNAEISHHVKIQIKPANRDYFTLKDGQKICLNSNNSELEQITYSNLDGQLLVVSIGGLDDQEKYFINFQREFEYPYVSK